MTILTQITSPPRTAKINALQLLHHDEPVTDLLRLQAISASVMNPAVRSLEPLDSLFHGVFAAKPPFATPESLIGYAALGPILYAFSRFIQTEIEQLQAAGKRPKAVFLMRDAYLPWQCSEALAGKTVGPCVKISRFSAFASSFRTTEDIDRYLVDTAASLRFNDLCRQLLLPDKIAASIIKALEKSAQPALDFIHLVKRKETQRIILQKSAEYAKRFLRHIDNAIDLQKDDTLIFIDLGYSGTAQRQLAPLFKERGINVIGRYLIALRSPNWENTRRGLLDPASFDDKTLKMLVSHIALLEQLCTANEKSVIDYDEDGHAIYSQMNLTQQQQTKLVAIQAECVRFIHEAKLFFEAMPLSISSLKKTTMAGLARLIFLPTQAELQTLQSFEFDFNLGTQDVLQLFDPQKGLVGLRRRGLFFIEKNSKSMRTNYPAELRAAGFELSLALMTQYRFNLDIKLKDMLLRREHLPAIITQNNQSYKIELEALSTHDGYFSVWLPIEKGDFQLAILLGKKYQWVQIDSAEFIPLTAFKNQTESQQTEDAWSFLRFDQMSDKGERLFKCSAEMSAVVLNPANKLNADNLICRLVFRPIIECEKHKHRPYMLA